MKGFVVASLVVGPCLLLAAIVLLGNAMADPDASCPDDPNPQRLLPPTVDIACVPTSLWDGWQGRTVVVTAGPFEGRQGLVQAVSGDHVQVAFPEVDARGLWFRQGQLELVEDAKGLPWWAHASHAWR